MSKIIIFGGFHNFAHGTSMEFNEEGALIKADYNTFFPHNQHLGSYKVHRGKIYAMERLHDGWKVKVFTEKMKWSHSSF